MEEADIAEIEKDIKIDEKIEDMLRRSEENIIRMHLGKTGSFLDAEDELKDYRILVNFQNVIHALTIYIDHEIASVKRGHYDTKQKQEIVGHLTKMKAEMRMYEDHLLQLRKLVIPPENLVNHPELASKIRSIMMKKYDELHDLYKDILNLDASVMVKIKALGHVH